MMEEDRIAPPPTPNLPFLVLGICKTQSPPSGSFHLEGNKHIIIVPRVGPVIDGVIKEAQRKAERRFLRDTAWTWF